MTNNRRPLDHRPLTRRTFCQGLIGATAAALVAGPARLAHAADVSIKTSLIS